jgi:hypothetical protein
MAALGERDQAIELLKTAIAGLGEMIADAGARQLPLPPARQAEVLAGLEAMAADAAVLTQACRILMNRSNLLR